MLEDALRSRYNVQPGREKEKMISDTAEFVADSKAGRGVGRGGDHGGTNKGKLDSRGRSEGLSSQAKITYNHYQKTWHVRPNYPEHQCFKCRCWGHETVSCPSKVPTPKESGKKKKDDSAVMAVDQKPDSEVTADAKLDEVGGGHTTCFMTP